MLQLPLQHESFLKILLQKQKANITIIKISLDEISNILFKNRVAFLATTKE